MTRIHDVRRSLWSALFFMTLAMAGTGCAEGGGTGNTAPNAPQETGDDGPRTPNGEASWVAVARETLTDDPINDSCSEEATFRVSSDSSWTYEHCRSRKAGSLAEEDQRRLEQLAEAVSNARLIERQCDSQSFSGNEEVKITIDDEHSFNVLEANARGTCYRGDANRARELQSFLIELETRYVLTTPSRWTE